MRLLSKALNYALPTIKLNYGDYRTPFQLFYPEIWKLPTEDHEWEGKKTDNKKEAYSSFDNYRFWDKLNFSKEENMALKGKCSNKNIVVQKVYKGNSVVLVKRADYVKRIKELLSDVGLKRLLLNLEINIVLQYGGILIDFLKQIKNYITMDLY